MPELPEVEMIRRVIEPQLRGRAVERVSVRRAEVIARPPAEAFCRRIAGQRFDGMARRGKFLLFRFAGGDRLLLHLRMTGCLLVTPADAPEEKHTHVVFQLDDGRQLRFSDTRRFGRFWLLGQGEAGGDSGVEALGLEPFDPALTASYLAGRLGGRRKTVKGCLLDQRVVAGIGNIYADEILFRAGVRPKKSAARLTKAECAAIVRATKEILAEAICAGGSTIRDYVDSSMRAGSFQLAHQVYGRAGKPCYSCGSILKSVTVGGRSSVYCPHCQKS